MNILVIGSGAVGGFFSFLLKEKYKDKLNLYLVNRNPAIIQNLKNNGLKVYLNKLYSFEVKEVFQSLDEIKANIFDFVFITIKAIDNHTLKDKLTKFRESIFIVVQNGIDNEEVFLSQINNKNLFFATITIPVYFKDSVLYTGKKNGGIAFSPYLKGTKNIEKVKDLFSNLIFEAKFIDDFRSLKWSKFILNIIGNTLPAYFQEPLDKFYSDDNNILWEINLLKEAILVADKLNIKIVDLPGYKVKLIYYFLKYFPIFILKNLLKKKLIKSRGEKLPSFFIDIQKGKKTEFLYYNGALLKYKDRFNIEIPYTEKLYNLYKEKKLF